MNLNLHILYDELNSFSPDISTSKGINLDLRQIRLFDSPQNELQQDCIYLVESGEIDQYLSILQGVDFISIGKFVENRPEYFGLSFISLPAEYSKNTVFNAVQDIFDKYNQWEYRLMKNIAANESLQAIFDLAVLYLKNPAVIFDISSAVIVRNSNMPSDLKGTIWESVVANNYAQTELLPQKEQFLHKPSKDTLFRSPTFVKGNYPDSEFTNLMLGINLNDKLFATLCTMSICAPITQGQISLFSYIRDSLEFLLSSRSDFNNPISDAVNYLDMLMKGLVVDEKIVKYHLAALGWHISDEFCIYNVSAAKGKILTEGQTKFSLYRIEKLLKSLLVFPYENNVIVVLRNPNSEENREFETQLTALLEKLDMHCGRSLIFNNFNDLKYYYIQSKVALYQGDSINSQKIVWHYEDYYFQNIVHLLDNSSSLKSLCHPAILRLYQHDSAMGSDYVHCLQTYIFNGCNIAQTSQDLYMHRNTLVYRLERIAAIIGMDAAQLDENTRMQLWLSCRICDLSNRIQPDD